MLLQTLGIPSRSRANNAAALANSNANIFSYFKKRNFLTIFLGGVFQVELSASRAGPLSPHLNLSHCSHSATIGRRRNWRCNEQTPLRTGSFALYREGGSCQRSLCWKQGVGAHTWSLPACRDIVGKYIGLTGVFDWFL